ncbi:MAG: NAD(P)H-dependent oxidoreductase [Acidobacteriota bacterium]|nr:MAG: NAD(P)H-dependent oxidoreductase [Acidobacteriota bacterium]
MPNRRVLILFAHPALEKSRVNRHLIDAVRSLRGVSFNDLYQQYPDLDIDVAREQQLLVEHDVIVMQHPLYWYSTPALIKQWEDLVLEHGWAYGRGGTALRGKTLLTATTTGGSEEAYCRTGHNRYTMRELLAPIEQTAVLCGLTYLPPFVVYGTHAISNDEIARHAADYRRVVEALRDDTLDQAAAANQPHLNLNLDAVLQA